jgi:xylulokinase
MYLIGLDVGSSFVKVAILNSQSNEVVIHGKQPAVEMDIISRQHGWAEQLPEVWWSNVCTLIKKLLHQSGIPPAEIKGIGISYQMHGLVLVDKDLQVLRPCIIWCDSRAVSIGSDAYEKLGESYFQQNLLNSPGNFTISKLKWIKDNEPDIYKRIYKILLPGDYINMKLSGEINTTISGLSEGMFWNFKEKRKAYEVLHHFDLEHTVIPDITETFSIMGRLSQTAAIETGLTEGTPITYRAGDQPNNALSLNIMRPGEIAATSGTSGVLFGIVDKQMYDPESRVNAFAHVNYEEDFKSLGILLCINGAGIQYAWVKHQMSTGDRNYEDMERMASSVAVGSDGICVLPFGNGAERIFENKTLGSHIFHLDFNRHSRAHMYRASLEGVAFSFVYGVKILKDMGINIEVIRVANDNMFQSKIFATTIATLLNANIEVVDTNGAIGAARAAGVKAGIYPTIEAALEKIHTSFTYYPDYNVNVYQMAYNKWLESLQSILLKNRTINEVTKTKNPLPNEKTIHEIEKSSIIAAQSLQLENLQNTLKSLTQSLDRIYLKQPSDDLKSVISKLKRQSQVKLQATQTTFELHFNDLNNMFFKVLKNHHPDLSHEEIKICGLLKMELSCKEMSNLLNISIRGMETKRYRIRKKLSLKSRTDIVTYFNSLQE